MFPPDCHLRAFGKTITLRALNVLLMLFSAVNSIILDEKKQQKHYVLARGQHIGDFAA